MVGLCETIPLLFPCFVTKLPYVTAIPAGEANRKAKAEVERTSRIYPLSVCGTSFHPFQLSDLYLNYAPLFLPNYL